jgi:folate-binding protein YgfZ
LRDPRHLALGWRSYGALATDDGTDWDLIRVDHVIPETLRELFPDESYILECGFERLNGVDFRKGCYVGQEVTARMKHKTELRKGLARIALSAPLAYGTEIKLGEKVIGRVLTVAGDHAIAYLRMEQIQPGITAGPSTVEIVPPACR